MGLTKRALLVENSTLIFMTAFRDFSSLSTRHYFLSYCSRPLHRSACCAGVARASASLRNSYSSLPHRLVPAHALRRAAGACARQALRRRCHRRHTDYHHHFLRHGPDSEQLLCQLHGCHFLRDRLRRAQPAGGRVVQTRRRGTAAAAIQTAGGTCPARFCRGEHAIVLGNPKSTPITKHQTQVGLEKRGSQSHKAPRDEKQGLRVIQTQPRAQWREPQVMGLMLLGVLAAPVE